MKTRVLSGVAAATVGLLLLGSAVPALAGGKPPTAKSLKNLAATIKSGKGQTYAAVYKSVSAGQTTTVNIAQQPPKSAFSSGSGEGSIIDTGTKTYFCSGSGGSQTCISAGSTNPLASLEDLFSPTAALAAFSTARNALGDHDLGIKTSTSSQTFAGQPSTCVTISIKAGTTSKYCVTKKGLLAYAGSSGSYFQLTSLSTSPPASLFALPSGATTVTLPGGGSIP
jgi:hypothetical protein